MTVDLSGKTAIVTGASKGIGYGIAEAIARSGANVAICSRNDAEVRGAAETLTAAGGGKVVGFACDMRSHDEVKRLVNAAVDSFGGVDVLVNNAGVGGFAPMGDLSPDVWHQIIETNLNGVYYACHEVIPHMIDRGQGWIINIGSLAGKNPFPGGAAYNASKFGLLGFSEAMMLDVRHKGIRVSCIMPGSVQSHFEGPNAHRGASDWKLQPEDIAEMVLDLLAFHSRALPSRVEMRPSHPPK
ncbi:MAG TPA: SDR family oxidoreductase [Longimicrobiaceae bacterium]|nr:SDR family oxidoreductase [Longimicrobiaceae bacterium]